MRELGLDADTTANEASKNDIKTICPICRRRIVNEHVRGIAKAAERRAGRDAVVAEARLFGPPTTLGPMRVKMGNCAETCSKLKLASQRFAPSVGKKVVMDSAPVHK
jgi:hypothetical protein